MKITAQGETPCRSMWRFAMTWSDESNDTRTKPSKVTQFIINSPLKFELCKSKPVMMLVCSTYIHNWIGFNICRHMGQLSLLPCGCLINSEDYKNGLRHVNPPRIYHSAQTRTNQRDQPIKQTTKATNQDIKRQETQHHHISSARCIRPTTSKFLGIQPARSLASQGASSVKWKDIYLLGCVGTCDIDPRDSENFKKKT